MTWQPQFRNPLWKQLTLSIVRPSLSLTTSLGARISGVIWRPDGGRPGGRPSCSKNIWQWRHTSVMAYENGIRLFVQQFIRLTKKKQNICITGALWGEPPVCGDLPTQMASDVDSVPTSWINRKRQDQVYGTTHSIQGFSSAIKSHLLNAYEAECAIQNCYVCQRQK